MSMMLQESRDKIHCDLLEGKSAFLCGDAIKWYSFLMGQNLVLLADCASLYVICYPLAHPCPWQDFSHFVNCFVSSGVSCRGMVVDEGHKVSFGGIWELRYVDSINEKFWFEESLIFVVIFSLI